MSKEMLTAIFSCVFLGSVLISSVSQILLKKSADKTYDSRIREYLNPLVIRSIVCTGIGDGTYTG